MSHLKCLMSQLVAQESTYESMGLPTMLNRFLDGYNVTFMAYGQTGTGKTHTMFGSQLGEVKHFEADGGEMPKQWGLFPRALISALERIKVNLFSLKLECNCSLTERRRWEIKADRPSD